MIFNYDVSDILTKLDNIDFSNAQNVTVANEHLDNYTSGGIYYFSGSYTPTNTPTGSGTFGFLIVLNDIQKSPARLVQFWIDSARTSNNVWMRSSSTIPLQWGDWKRFIADEDLKAKELTVTTVSSLPTGVTAVGTITAVQTGNVVTVSLDVTRNSTAMSTYAAIATGLPAPKKRPSSSSLVVPLGQIYAASATTGRPLNITVATNGNLSVNQGGVAAQYLGTFTYITDEI